MYKKTITYTDYNDVERTEDFYFNLNRAELTKLEMSKQNGFSALLKSIIDKKDGPSIMENFDRIIRMAYGEKSEDGRRFMKSKEISDSFAQTPAYDALFMELCMDSKAAATFVNAIMPKDIQAEVSKNGDIVDFTRNK